MSDLWEHDPSEAWGIPIDLDEAYWQCDCGADTYNPNENTHCFACGKPAPTTNSKELGANNG